MIFCSGHGYAVGMDVTFNVILLFFLFPCFPFNFNPSFRENG